jgi:diguanylate cyclase (GGDEF)-like protein
MNEALDRALLQQTDRLKTLNEISRVVSASLDLHTLYDTIFHQVSRVMDTTSFFIALRRSKHNTMGIPYFREADKLDLDHEVPYEDSVTTLVIERGVALLFHSDDEYRGFARSNGLPELDLGESAMESMIFVPLNTGSRTIGALSIQSEKAHAYTWDDVQTLTVIASQAAVAIENARLYQESQSAVREMQALLQIAQLINGSLDLPTVLDAILAGMREVMPYYFATILLPNLAERHLYVAATVGPMEGRERAEERRQHTTIPFAQGITGHVYQTGEALVVSDVSHFPHYHGHDDDNIRSEMAVPLKRGDLVVGVLDVERTELGAFSPDELDLLTLFASQAAIAIENARLFTDQQRRVVELQAIQSIVQQLTPLHDIPAIATLINRELKGLIDYHSCRVFSLDARQGLLVPIAVDQDSTHHLIGPKLGEGITGQIAQRGEAMLIPNLKEEPRARLIPGTPEIDESMIGAPLSYQDQVQGVITLTKLGAHQFDENDLRLLEIIAAQAAIAFDRARLYDELRTEAVTDELTKLYNRRYLGERFKEERSRAIRNGHTLVALMLDIDMFKRVNDSYGHDAGDVVLRELALLTRGVVRAEDIVVRYGGEEFCVLMPEIPVDDAAQVAERLRSAIEHHQLREPAGVRHVTVSVGLACLFNQVHDDDLFSRADAAMYAVKRIGGNRVGIAEAGGIRFFGDATPGTERASG